MIILSWNCRGAASRDFCRTLKEIIRQNNPDIVILMETRCSGRKALSVVNSISMPYHHMEEANGFSGGIWILWRDPGMNVSFLKSRRQYVHMEIRPNNDRSWFLTAVYASPQEQNRRSLWKELNEIGLNQKGEWLLVGDFNEIADPNEKKGGARTDINACRRFASWIQNTGLIDIGFVGAKFTWRGPQWNGLERVFKRLDRALSNADWRVRFDEAKLEVLTRRHSDHHPILITLNPFQNQRMDRPFRYEAMWSLHPDFGNCIAQNWKDQMDLKQSLEDLTVALKGWNKETFGNINKRKKEIMRRLGGIQRATDYGKNLFLERLEKHLNKKLEEILDREEMMWLQKSRENWLIEGDRNTRYFHTRTTIRRRKNKILKLRNQNGTGRKIRRN
ncbi:uncharacterized protein [Arachis hypogaea]|uniref:uncharacterized protein n=1 Tax=Arachis hypogaea TaxID=3818 RepID=UPI000DED03E1|nr:uncharacterized protein LOC112709432 [Arachis hypogaea]